MIRAQDNEIYTMHRRRDEAKSVTSIQRDNIHTDEDIVTYVLFIKYSQRMEQ